MATYICVCLFVNLLLAGKGRRGGGQAASNLHPDQAVCAAG